jgi:hypothetical protein
MRKFPDKRTPTFSIQTMTLLTILPVLLGVSLGLGEPRLEAADPEVPRAVSDPARAGEPSALTPGLAEAELEYLSDFLCFVGGDASGRVLLAVDLNRGRNGKKLEGEQFVALHVEGQGWLEVGGKSDLKVDALEALPDSGRWEVSGERQSGFRLVCPERELDFSTGRLDAVALHSQNNDLFSTGAGTGTLRLGKRTIAGIVHHEYCFLRGINPLAKTYTDLFGDGFHGLYCSVGLGAEASTLRLHKSGGRLEPLILRQNGFEKSGQGSTRLDLGRLRISDWSLGGFFRWPGRYRLDWTRPTESGQLGHDGQRSTLSFDLRVRQRETVVNYVFGGVAVAIVEGTARVDGQDVAIYGLALIVR